MVKFPAFVILLWLFLIHAALAQTGVPIPYEVRVAPAVAEKVLVHKVDPVCKPIPMGARVTGTVVVNIEIRTHGDVLHPTVISGPKRLISDALAAVRPYRYKPLC